MLVVYPFRLILSWPGRHTLPPYLGSTIRGIFASSFRRLVCVTRAPTCEAVFYCVAVPTPTFETPAPSDPPEALRSASSKLRGPMSWI
jgi:hypothetical protein